MDAQRTLPQQELPLEPVLNAFPSLTTNQSQAEPALKDVTSQLVPFKHESLEEWRDRHFPGSRSESGGDLGTGPIS